MAFDSKKLPLTVQAAFKQGPMAWALVVEKCLNAGMYDINELTDIVFYLHHPERNGRPLLASETTKIKQWKGFRTLIQPRIGSYLRQFHVTHLEGTDVGGGG
jgi:hypothetical protein